MLIHKGYAAEKDATTLNVKAESIEEEVTIKVLVDPYTKLMVQIKGEGQVSNGVASYYTFWKRIRLGGWEVFTITTEYYSIEKVRLDEN